MNIEYMQTKTLYDVMQEHGGLNVEGNSQTQNTV